jgi:Cu(I)/Ag(I) efflux system membrane fusion protein
VVVAANFLIDSESNLRSALNAFGNQGGQSGAGAMHQGEGRVESVDLVQSSATINHGPISSLKWPGMTMEFKVKDPALLRTLKPGQNLGFEFLAEPGGDYVIVRFLPAASKAATGSKALSASKPAAGSGPAVEPGPAVGGHAGH